MSALHLHDALHRRKLLAARAATPDSDAPDTFSLTAREAFWITVVPIIVLVCIVVAVIVVAVNR